MTTILCVSVPCVRYGRGEAYIVFTFNICPHEIRKCIWANKRQIFLMWTCVCYNDYNGVISDIFSHSFKKTWGAQAWFTWTLNQITLASDVWFLGCHGNCIYMCDLNPECCVCCQCAIYRCYYILLFVVHAATVISFKRLERSAKHKTRKTYHEEVQSFVKN